MIGYTRETSEGNIFRHYKLSQFGLQVKAGARPIEKGCYDTVEYKKTDLEPIINVLTYEAMWYKRIVYESYLRLKDEGFDQLAYLEDLKGVAKDFHKGRFDAALEVRHYPKEIPLSYRNLDLHYYDDAGKLISFSRATYSKNVLKTFVFGNCKLDGKTITAFDAVMQTIDILRNGPYKTEKPVKHSKKSQDSTLTEMHEKKVFPFPDKISFNGTPSVYVFYDDDDSVLYVGKSSHLGRRIARHLEESPFAKDICQVGIMQFRSTKDADLMEIVKIHEYDPRFNKDCRPDEESSVIMVHCNTEEVKMSLWDLPAGITGIGNQKLPEEKLITLRGLRIQKDAEILLRHLFSGDTSTYLEFKEEPENRFDKNAISVWIRGEFYGKIGYVGKEFTATVRELVENGSALSISDITIRIPEIPTREIPNTLDVYIS